MTTTYWGFLQYQQFYMEDVMSPVLNPFAAPRLLLAGLPYGLAVITFLLAHEMGHYLACRYYGIRATLPYFLPFPPLIPLPGGFVPVLVPGTMGAVIRILSPLKSRRALFDVAIAGPLAGFLVALPILAIGLGQSRVVDLDDLGPSLSMGEPLIWGPMQAVFAPAVGPDQTLLAHPLAFVGWFALLVTAMNLLPVGQLDGGHLLYTVAPRAHRWISLVVVTAMAYAGFVYFTGWLVFALLVLLVLGTRHPRPVVFEQRLGAKRLLLLLVAILILVTCFMLVPVSMEL
jgi:membrane-associated protease RseP (regulator of RpoE activity)